ncbi:MAG: hypothetical protein HOQ35_15100 [Acidobacteriaceae bacterium]|nr:hypothetical protein [Acidobacteriaceae bacterium]
MSTPPQAKPPRTSGPQHTMKTMVLAAVMMAIPAAAMAQGGSGTQRMNVSGAKTVRDLSKPEYEPSR